MPTRIFQRGTVGIVSRSGTLTYEIAASISRKGFGQTTCVGIGGDPMTGLDFAETLKMFERDKETEVIALIGEIGGNSEETAAAYIRANVQKPIVAYIAGRTVPPNKRMGHAGAIIAGSAGTAEVKIEALETVGVLVAERPTEVAELIEKIL
jgi:succinyl-CoA synthetase alpha subunit